jgi:endo-1,4-beta-xylanase
MYSRRQFTVASTAFMVAGPGCAQTVTNDASAAGGEVPSLYKTMAPFFPLGVAVTPGQVSLTSANFIKKHFNILVAENAMKPIELARKAQGKYEFEAADDIVNFAKDNAMKMRGHTLVWHQQTPPWLFTEGGKDVTREQLINRMDQYITDVVTHFKGRVYAWDVVNEAFSFGEGGVEVDDKGMRMSGFRRIIGPEYIELAFRMAAKADPNALLFYNDYETQSQLKLSAIVNMVKDLKTRGVKIDGIGHQAHCTVAQPSINSMEYAIEEIAKLGVTQQITELDIALNGNIMESKITSATPELLKRQAQRYADFFELFMRQRTNISAVLMWGINDASSWLQYWPRRRFEAPMLFDDRSQPKPAFWSVINKAKEMSNSLGKPVV